MKALERIFFYSVLAILVFYVFLLDNKVESQVAIQEEIRARRIVIVNDAGQGVVLLSTNEDGNGKINVANKDGTPVANMGVDEYGGAIRVNNKNGNTVVGMGATEHGGIMGVNNKDGTSTVTMGADEDGGKMGIVNKAGNPVAVMTVYKDDGLIQVYNREGDMIGSLP